VLTFVVHGLLVAIKCPAEQWMLCEDVWLWSCPITDSDSSGRCWWP